MAFQVGQPHRHLPGGYDGGMEEQKSDGSERRTGIFIAVALLLLAVPCLAGVALVGVGAVMFYRLAESPPAVAIPPDTGTTCVFHCRCGLPFTHTILGQRLTNPK